MRNRRASVVRAAVVAALCAVWAVAVGAGFVKLWTHAGTPGPPAHASATWPNATRLLREDSRHTLVLFLHPYCACSHATMEEVGRLVAHVRERLAIHVLVYRPSEAAPGWEHTALWESAARIPGVDVSSDEDAREAGVFDAYVSGQTLLYDTAGRLVFTGGITFARGHEGDNDGRTAIQSLVMDGTAQVRQTPVFGCFLRPRLEG
jgi:hypothetical protein